MSEFLYEVAAISDLTDGQMKEVEAESKKILLARVGGQFYATSAHCPHYGVSLAEGILCGERVVCPWHKSVFSVITGDLLEPPALDRLTHYKVSVKDTGVFVHLPAAEPSSSPVFNEPDSTCFAIIGAGAAGVAAAEQLRDLGFTGRLVLLTGETEPPYDRTKLSKEFLSGNAMANSLALRPPDFWEQHAVERSTQPVTDLDPAAHRLRLADGSSLVYDRLLVASGSTPKAIAVPGADLGNIFTLRSQADAEAIWQQAQPGVRIVIVGGSLIALEVASCFATRKLPVTVIVSEETPFAKQFGREVGRIFQQWHESHGVEFRVDSEVDHFEGTGMVRSVVLKSGEKIPADVVVVGVGVRPATGFTGSLPKQDDGGLLTDSLLRVTKEIYAAGDIAIFPEVYSGVSTRIEHWRVAEQHGRAAAHNMLGSQQAFDGVPYFWTNHFGTRFDYVGHAKEWDEVILQFGEEAPTFIAFYVSDGVVKAAAACHYDNEIAALHELIRLRKVPTPEEIRRGADLVALATGH